MELYIYGEIGDWYIEPAQEADVLHINSYGGDVSAGLAIYNAIKDRDVEVLVEGFCASAATLICCGGKVRAAKNSLFMLHLPSVFLSGNFNATDLEKVGNGLDAVKGAVLETYKDKVGDVEEMLKEETWLTASQAKDLGLVDEVEGLVATDLTQAYVEMNCVKLPRNKYNQRLVLAYMTSNKKQAARSINKQEAESKKPAEKFAEVIAANMQSGAEGVGGSFEAEDNLAKAKQIAKFF